MMKQLLVLAALTAAVHWPLAALAHGGATPRHGGVVQMVSDLSFELVTQAGGVAIYVEDHGKPMAPTGMSGKLSVLTGGQRSEAVLAVAGDKLVATDAGQGCQGGRYINDAICQGHHGSVHDTLTRRNGSSRSLPFV